MKSELTSKMNAYGGQAEIAKSFLKNSDTVDIIFFGGSNIQSSMNEPSKANEIEMGFCYF